MTIPLLFLSKSESSPSTRYRALAYFPLLKEKGWNPQHLSLSSHPWEFAKILREARKAKAVILLRKLLSPFYFFLLRKMAKTLIFDLDDAIDGRDNLIVSRQRKRNFLNMARKADQIWAGNHYLLEKASSLNPSTQWIPTSIDLSLYEVQPSPSTVHLDLVWIGSRSTRKYLEEVLPLLERLSPKFPSLRLKIIADFVITSPQIPILSIPWNKERETLEIASAHIGIAPMPENEWTKGKCGLKLLQYMASKIPVLASPTGVHRDMVQPGKNGYLVENFEEWEKALEKLKNPVLRDSMGLEGWKMVQEKYSLEKTFERIQGNLSLLP